MKNKVFVTIFTTICWVKQAWPAKPILAEAIYLDVADGGYTRQRRLARCKTFCFYFFKRIQSYKMYEHI